MHAIKDRPMAVNGQVVIQPMMYLALSYDHRLIDGKIRRLSGDGQRDAGRSGSSAAGRLVTLPGAACRAFTMTMARKTMRFTA